MVFLCGFMLSSILWCFICAGFIGIVRQTINQKIWVIINLFCGFGLAYFSYHVLINAFYF
ncbi:MAG: chemotaxis protein, partial [Amylibacter sp.]